MMERITAADGHELDCWMEPAKGEASGGLVILQEIFGVTDQLKNLAKQYAARGYEVAVPALFDRKERGTVIPFDSPERGREMMLASDLGEIMQDVKAAVDCLSAKGTKVAVIGFCWGGGLAIRAAQELDIACAVSYYGTGLPKYLDRPLAAPVLGHFGTRDDHVPADMLDKAMRYLPEMKVHLYDAGHAFANDARAAYVKEEAELAQTRTLSFLKKHLG